MGRDIELHPPERHQEDYPVSSGRRNASLNGSEHCDNPVAGPFGEFIRAVNDVLPNRFKLGNLDHLIRAYGVKSREKAE